MSFNIIKTIVSKISTIISKSIKKAIKAKEATLAAQMCQESIIKYHISSLLNGTRSIYFVNENPNPKIKQIKVVYTCHTWDESYIHYVNFLTQPRLSNRTIFKLGGRL